MSEEQLKAFLEAVRADAGLLEKLNAAKDADAVVAIAKAEGFAISAEELKKSQAEISEEELERVAGGAMADVTHCGCMKTPDDGYRGFDDLSRRRVSDSMSVFY
jgi:bacteriocin propeptide, TIGR03798 family